MDWLTDKKIINSIIIGIGVSYFSIEFVYEGLKL